MTAKKRNIDFKHGDYFSNDGKLGCACGLIGDKELKNAISSQFCDNCSTDAILDGGFEIVGTKDFIGWYSRSDEYFGEPDRQNISSKKYISNKGNYPALNMVATTFDILSIVLPLIIMTVFFYNFANKLLEPIFFIWFIFLSFSSWLGYRFLAENIRLFINIANDVRDIKNKK